MGSRAPTGDQETTWVLVFLLVEGDCAKGCALLLLRADRVAVEHLVRVVPRDVLRLVLRDTGVHQVDQEALPAG